MAKRKEQFKEKTEEDRVLRVDKDVMAPVVLRLSNHDRADILHALTLFNKGLVGCSVSDLIEYVDCAGGE